MPPPGEQVIVHCKSFQCMGRYGADKQWRGVFSNQALTGVTGWSRPGDGKINPVTEFSEEFIVTPVVVPEIAAPDLSAEELTSPDCSSKPSEGPTLLELWAEAHAAAFAEAGRRRQKTVKQTFWFAGFAVCVMLMWMLKLELDIRAFQSSCRNLEMRVAELDAENTDAVTGLSRMADVDQKLAALDQLAGQQTFKTPLLGAVESTAINHNELLPSMEAHLQEASYGN
jgi:hypothetical protein